MIEGLNDDGKVLLLAFLIIVQTIYF